MIGIIVITILAFVFGVIIVNIDNKSSKADEIVNLLPGYNCGACGYKGCEHLAREIANNPMLYTKCRTLRGDNLLKMKEYLKETYGVNIEY